MRKNLKYSFSIITILISMMILPSCNDLLNPEQDLDVTKDQLFKDYYEYRSTDMGLYGLQQKLVEQLVVLGELRADLMTITPNADADLIEIYNFQAKKTNKYADPTNFYKLISACNSFISVIKEKHPEVLDKKIAVTNYDRLYGEVLCMRAWAYFNAVRIYGKIPVIYESLTSVKEIEDYVNSPSTYIDSVNIVFDKDGFHNDTTKMVEVKLEKQFYTVSQVIDVFSKQLEQGIKIVDGKPIVGVNNYMNNNDNTWEVTVWNMFAWHALLGQMYLTSGDLTQSAKHFNAIANFSSDNYRYQLDGTFANAKWREIFTGIDVREHILTIWFNKANQQQNDFQRLFEPFQPHQYMLKPTKAAIDFWETIWSSYALIVPDQTKPWLTKLDKKQRGIPSDFYRGFGTSYQYVKNGAFLEQGTLTSKGVASPKESYAGMLLYKMDNDKRSYSSLMQDVDTIVYKYSINKSVYDQDANFIVYRAAGIQLYLGEIYTWWAFQRNEMVSTFTSNAVDIVNDGRNYSVGEGRRQLGVRGRVFNQPSYNSDGSQSTTTFTSPLQVGNINYIHDPNTNEVTGYKDLTGNFLGIQMYLEELILDEKARELAYEGERFYDLMRVAKRRNDPSFLAKKVSAKYPAGMREAIYNKLLDEKNWYINLFE